MKLQPITYETAKLAREKGFPVLNFDTEKEFKKWRSHSAPIQQLLQKWLREKYGVDVWCEPSMYKSGHYRYNMVTPVTEYEGKDFPTYEEALEKGLQHVLKIMD